MTPVLNTWYQFSQWRTLPKGVSCVYIIRNTINNKEYVGKSFCVRKRMGEHFNRGGNCTYLYAALSKYGANCFEFCIYMLGGNAETRDSEIALIKDRNTVAPYGMNLTTGGEGTLGYQHTEVTKQRLREKALGRVVSPETRSLISAASSGRVHSIEVRKKLSVANTGRVFSVETKGKKCETLSLVR